jgi:hypothetical protein
MLVKLPVGDRQCGVAADQETGGGVGCQAIEVGILQDRNPLLGFLQQTGLDELQVPTGNALPVEYPAAQIAASDPFHVFFDRNQAIRNPVQPVLRRGA